MTNVVDIGLERVKRNRRVTTGSRQPAANRNRGNQRIEQVIRRHREYEDLRRGDTVETTEGRAFILDDSNGLLATCRGNRFFLMPEHVARPEDGIA